MADDNEFGPLFRAAVEQHVAAMSNEDFAKLTALRPPTDAASTRRSIGAKAGQLWAVTQQCDENGYTAGMSDAAAARQPQPAPQPEPQAPQGFTANRAQGASGDGPPAPVQQERLPNPYHRIYPGGTL